MVTQTINVNGRDYGITLSEQTTMLVTRLRQLYNASYGDVESFDEISGAISNTINDLRKYSINPDPVEEDLDGVIQGLLKLFETKSKNETKSKKN
ncbi:MAG: hypothetical protein EX285_08845 [Thaumarchaeota archaeon]|nr:hypothetical protein [Nitrososphaerota archaeon]